jgi:hypothetical protein
MIVYSGRDFAFQHVNRCGGMSVVNVCNDIAGPPDPCTVRPGSQHQPIHTRLKRLSIYWPDVDVRMLSIYANIRNPFDRLVSIYARRCDAGRYLRAGRSFKWFFYNEYLPTNTTPNGPIEPMLAVNGKLPDGLEVIKFEDMADRWPAIIKKHFDVELREWPRCNSSNHENPMSYYDNSMVKEVQRTEQWAIKYFYPELEEL